MNHRPFEDWLLDDQPLTLEQKRALQGHLRTCDLCAALAESNLALKSTRMLTPAAGFASRFQARLTEQRKAARRRHILGALVFALGGVGLLVWLAGPFIVELVRSPAEWITAVVGYLLFIVTSIQALSQVGLVLLRVLPGFVPPIGWMVLASALAGLVLLWTVSIWRFARLPQGA